MAAGECSSINCSDPGSVHRFGAPEEKASLILVVLRDLFLSFFWCISFDSKNKNRMKVKTVKAFGC
ncbi:hypothetical protein MUK42_28582 [Musa troglodytarum]|uniref:Uncharacterized protein n=1 Tax=Musa troglodytarum TaxID=320322 RepID=A0A9E7G882_9LILI|nr:hypothetical protein MUK42_28582 [Musa troglodytarum]